jgi:hypothetical protein
MPDNVWVEQHRQRVRDALQRLDKADDALNKATHGAKGILERWRELDQQPNASDFDRLAVWLKTQIPSLDRHGYDVQLSGTDIVWSNGIDEDIVLAPCPIDFMA